MAEVGGYRSLRHIKRFCPTGYRLRVAEDYCVVVDGMGSISTHQSLALLRYMAHASSCILILSKFLTACYNVRYNIAHGRVLLQAQFMAQRSRLKLDNT